MTRTLSIQISGKNHAIQTYYQKIDFIEKTYPIYHKCVTLDGSSEHFITIDGFRS